MENMTQLCSLISFASLSLVLKLKKKKTIVFFLNSFHFNFVFHTSHILFHYSSIEDQVILFCACATSWELGIKLDRGICFSPPKFCVMSIVISCTLTFSAAYTFLEECQRYFFFKKKHSLE